MATHCTNCGHELREGDKFCAECGTPAGGTAVPPKSIQWEYCEISKHMTRNSWSHSWHVFWAQAVSPVRGEYNAGTSQEFQWSSDGQAERAALDAFIQQLSSIGWELLPNRGEENYSYKFRRPSDPQLSGSASDLIERGKALEEQKKYAEALPFFQRATQQAPDSFDAWFRVGYTLLALRRHTEALMAYDRALALSPKSAGVWYNRGLALENLKRYEEALAAYERGFDSKDARDWRAKARCLRALGRTAEADAAEKRASAI